MKNYIALFTTILFFFSIISCTKNSNVKVAEGDTTTIYFYDTLYNFGRIIEGEKVNYTFKFKNTGEKPLLISKVYTSCGCTASNYTDYPVKPNSEGYVKVTFNSSNRSGNVHKTITVIANTRPQQTILHITGSIESSITKN